MIEARIDDPAPRLRQALLDAIHALAPEVDVTRLAADRPLRDQVELDSMDWLNLADTLAEATGRMPGPDGFAPAATIDSLVAALAAGAPPADVAVPESAHRLADGREVRLRPLRADDAPLDQEFVRRLSGDSRYQRFMAALRELPPAKLASLTQVDQRRHLAIVATTRQGGGEVIVGVARSIADADGDDAEFAIVVADAWQGCGLAGALMRALIAAARAHGVRRLYGIVLATNRRMLGFVRRLGFDVRPDPDDRRLVHVARRLAP